MNCIFGLFDVLGFTSFCENCDFQSAEKVLKIMDDFETALPEMVWLELDPDNRIPAEKKSFVTSRLHWLTFSDTVFVAMPIDDLGELRFNLLFFTILVAHINRRMFEIGLPVRGAVHVGDMIISKRCFAGRSIIDAHRLGEKIQVAGAVVSDQAEAFIKGSSAMLPNLIIECNVSMGTNTSKKVKTLCWFYLQLGRSEPFKIPADLNGFITEKFTANGKKLSEEKDRNKVNHTAKLFRDWQDANHEQYLAAKHLG